MPTFCAVVNCGTVGGQGVGMFRFPSKYNNHGKLCPFGTERLQKWTQAVKRADLTLTKIKYERVCAKHFILGKAAALKDKDNPDWVPSLHMGHISQIVPKLSPTQSNESVQHREKERETLQLTSDELNEVVENVEVAADNEKAEGTVEDALIAANTEIFALGEQLINYNYSREALEMDSEKCLYYTGFPNIKYIDVLYDHVEQFLKDGCSLTKFEQLILTLIKLRKNFDFEDLGYQFQVDHRTCSRCFHNCLYVLYRRLKNFVFWPEREILQKAMPLDFKSAFGNKITVIIDCLEVFIEKPLTVQAASRTFSHQNVHSTIKFLIGIIPCGVIGFISEAFDGRCSDKFITENSGILEKLLPGDGILVDLGVLRDESVCLDFAEVICPAFLKGQIQLLPADVERIRKIANLRIHVERLIGVVRQKYKILAQVIPTSLLNDENSVTTVDQIVQVCCSLTNLCPSVVSLI